MGALLTGVGLVTPVGDCAAQSCAAIRAGVARIRELRVATLAPDGAGRAGDPARASWVPELGAPDGPSAAMGLDRLAGLARMAIADLVRTAALRRVEAVAAHVVWAVDPLPEDLEVAELAQRCGLAAREIVTGGRSAGLEAVGRAVEAVRSGRASRSIVVAVGSHFDWPHLEALDQAGRLRSRRNQDGRVPGEAAAALLIEAESDRAPLARVESVACSDGHPTLGKALVDAIRAAAGDPPDARWTIGDLHGESAAAREWAVAAQRLHAARPWSPLDATGDVGAAAGGLFATLAARAWARGYAPERRAVLFCGSEGARRVAAVLIAPEKA